MSIYMHRRMSTICFLSKSQNIFYLPLAQKWFFAKKKRNTVATAEGVLCLEKYNIYMWMAKEKGNNAYTYVSIHVYTYT